MYKITYLSSEDISLDLKVMIFQQTNECNSLFIISSNREKYAVQILKKLQKEIKEIKLICFPNFRFIFVFVIEAFFVYCKVVKEKEYNSFLNR